MLTNSASTSTGSVVDKHCILTESLMRIAYPGGTLEAMGIEVDDVEAYYLYQSHMAVIGQIGDDGLFVGEDSYVGGDGFKGIADRKLNSSDVVLYEPWVRNGRSSTSSRRNIFPTSFRGSACAR